MVKYSNTNVIRAMTKDQQEPYSKIAVDAKTARQILDDVRKKVLASRHLSWKHVNSVPPSLAQLDRTELKLKSIIGTGTFSEVYELESIDAEPGFNKILRSRNYKLNRKKILLKSKESLSNGSLPFVVKHLRPILLNKKKDFRHAATELLLEAYYLASFNHPNIISVRAIAARGPKAYVEGFHDGFFIVMDRVEMNLSDKMKQWKSLPARLSDRIEIIQKLASAAEYLHERFIIYRDFKPANVGFDIQGNVKLLDFGLIAEIPKGESYLTSCCGTPRYMAPEVYFRKPYDYKVDVYSITVILWEILASQRYFNDLNVMNHVHHVLQEGARETISDKWPSEIRSILHHGWSGNPIIRPSMHDFRARLSHEGERLRRHLSNNGSNSTKQGFYFKSSSGETESSEETEEIEKTIKFGDRIEL